MKNKINVGDLIMEWKDRPHDRPQRLCYVIKKLGKNKDGVLLCPVGEEPPKEEQIIWLEEDILDWKVNNER